MRYRANYQRRRRTWLRTSGNLKKHKMSTEKAKRETLISNIGFFQMKLQTAVLQPVERLDKHTTEELQAIHDGLAGQFQAAGLDQSQGPIKFVYDKIVAELNKAN